MSATEMNVTNVGYSRHIACKLCRDRKVRCGGEQPQCQKCIRAGERCVYLPTQRPSKADLAQTVETLQKRLEEAEAYIARLNASSGTVVTPPSSNNNTSHALPSSADQTPGERVDSLPDVSNYPDQLHERNNLQALEPDLPDSLTWQTLENQVSIVPFSVDEEMHIDPASLDLCAQNEFSFRREINEDTGAAVLGPVSAFSSAVLRNQAESSVMGSLIADYIAWLRKVPPGGGASINQEPHYVGILETIETRVRELCDASQTRSNSALQELIAALEEIAPPGGAMAARLAGLEEQLQKEAGERAEFFRSRYNICALLTEQARNFSQ